jgi:GTP-binding protein
MNKTNLLKIALVGRPNVGKSSLFNKIIGAKKAIVESSSGTTRDRLHAQIRWRGKGFTIVDTAGFDASTSGDMAGLVLKQFRSAVAEADIILFVTDCITGVVSQDRELSSMLRKTSKKVYLIVNKADKESDAVKAMEFFELGIGEPYPVSALQGRGIDKLCDDLVKDIEESDAIDSTKSVRVAIVGRPNVGKSSYLNSILNEERVIVHPISGTTRDAVDIDFKYKDRDYILIDTAGMRHNAKMKEAMDLHGSVSSKEAIKRCDIAVVLIDGFEGLTKDSARIIGLCLDEGKAVVIAVNKWDLVKEVEMSKYRDRMLMNMSAVKDLPVVFISCKTGRNVMASLDVIWSVYEKSKAVVHPDKLADILKSLNSVYEINSKSIKFRSLTQEGVKPPGFIFGVKSAKNVNENLKRFVENFFRDSYDFEGVPIRIRFKK